MNESKELLEATIKGLHEKVNQLNTELTTKQKEAIGLHLGPVTKTAAFDFDGPDSYKTFEYYTFLNINFIQSLYTIIQNSIK